MGQLSDDLKALGYEPTEQQSPFDEEGELWTKGYELVCDETAIVIDKDYNGQGDTSFRGERTVYRYRNSGNVKLAGGHVSSYDWGTDEESNKFLY